VHAWQRLPLVKQQPNLMDLPLRRSA